MLQLDLLTLSHPPDRKSEWLTGLATRLAKKNEQELKDGVHSNMARQMECLPSLLDLFYVFGCKKIPQKTFGKGRSA